MADSLVGSTIRLLADGLATSLSLTVTVYDALGTSRGSASATEVGSGRYVVTITSSNDTIEGLWTATWKVGATTHLTQEFTRDQRRSITRYQFRLGVADIVDHSHLGIVDAATADTVRDATLFAGDGNYRGWYVVPDPDRNDSGKFRRVTDYAGDTLTFTTAALVTPTAGDDYALLSVDPKRIDHILSQVALSVRHAARIPVVATGLAVDVDGLMTIPDGWSGVYDIHLLREDADTSIPLHPSYWEMYPGRKLIIPAEADEDDTITLYGLRYGYAPLFDHSELDWDPLLIEGMVTSRLHRRMAAGSVTDPDEHFRRGITATQELDAIFWRKFPRIQRNFREVLA